MFDVLRIRRYEKLALCEFDAFPIAQMRVQRNKSWPIPYKLYFDIFFYWLLEKNERNTTVNCPYTFTSFYYYFFHFNRFNQIQIYPLYTI